MDLTDISTLILRVVVGDYALERVVSLLDKEERVLIRLLSSRAEYIEAAVLELRRRECVWERPRKVSRRFTHSHKARVLPKASRKRPYAGWDDECFLGDSGRTRRHRNNEHSQLPHPSEYGYLVKRARFSDHEGRHTAEELMHARELDDLAALEHDEWVLDLAYEDDLGRSWQEEDDAFWDSLEPWWAHHEEAEDVLFAEMREFVEEAPLVQVDTWDGPCMRVTEYV